MPYYVYKIHAPRRLERVGDFASYRDARTHARSLRSQLGAEGGECAVRMVFAGDPTQAERLLTEQREPRPLGEE